MRVIQDERGEFAIVLEEYKNEDGSITRILLPVRNIKMFLRLIKERPKESGLEKYMDRVEEIIKLGEKYANMGKKH